MRVSFNPVAGPSIAHGVIMMMLCSNQTIRTDLSGTAPTMPE